jgi:hypothetical protein
MPLLPGLQIPCPLHSTHVLDRDDSDNIFVCPTTGDPFVISWGNGMIPLRVNPYA